MPLLPNAGQDSTASVCNTSGTQIDLNTLLSSDADSQGGFSESSSSGSFDPISGVFVSDGLTPGVYSFTYTVNGYDGVTDASVFDVTVNPSLSSSESMIVCDNQFPFDWNGLSITEEGSVSVTLNSAVTGCDSTVTLNVQVNPTLNATENIVVCSNAFPFEWNGITISNGFGTPSVNFVSEVTGCDSIVTLNISVNPILFVWDTITICENELPYNWNGLSLTESGTQSDRLSSFTFLKDSLSASIINI